ncbi:MAG: 3-hydroxyacyl-ACP dehydratase FabZ family protein [Hyphomicrobiales bacterium]
MKFLFVDRVTYLRRGERMSAVLALPPDLPIFAIHFPACPVLPASLILESFAQAATILIETGHDFTRKALVAYLRGAKFRQAVHPPEPLDLDLIVEHWSEDGALIDCRASQSGALCASCDLGMKTAPLSSFYGAEHATAYRLLYERWLDGASVEGFAVDPRRVLRDGHVL